MLFWKITLVAIGEIKGLVEDLQKEKSNKDLDSPGKLTGDEIAYVCSTRLMNLIPKIIGIVKDK